VPVLVPVCNLLEMEDRLDWLEAFDRAAECLNAAIPMSQADPAQTIEYLYMLRSFRSGNDVVDTRVGELLQTRIAKVEIWIGEQLAGLSISDRTVPPDWIWEQAAALQELATVNESQLEQVVSQLVQQLRHHCEQKLQQALTNYESLESDEWQLERALEQAANEMELLSLPGVVIVGWESKIEQSRSKRQQIEMSKRIGAIQRLLADSHSSLDAIRLELALLPGTQDREQMATVLDLNNRLQQRVAADEQKKLEQKRAAYNRWAESELTVIRQMLERKYSGEERQATKVRAAKQMADIDEQFLNRVVAQLFQEVHEKAMKGLNEQQKLEVYRAWATRKPRTPESL